MIHWEFKNDAGISPERREEAKGGFIKKIGPYRQEFEENEGYVQVDFDVPPEVGASYSFSFKGDLSGFIQKVNDYIRGNL